MTSLKDSSRPWLERRLITWRRVLWAAPALVLVVACDEDAPLNQVADDLNASGGEEGSDDSSNQAAGGNKEGPAAGGGSQQTNAGGSRAIPDDPVGGSTSAGGSGDGGTSMGGEASHSGGRDGDVPSGAGGALEEERCHGTFEEVDAAWLGCPLSQCDAEQGRRFATVSAVNLCSSELGVGKIVTFGLYGTQGASCYYLDNELATVRVWSWSGEALFCDESKSVIVSPGFPDSATCPLGPLTDEENEAVTDKPYTPDEDCFDADTLTCGPC